MEWPMQTPRDRYNNDVAYRRVVDTMTHMLLTAQITPSEMREAAVLASINHESMTIRRYHIDLTPDLHRRLDEMHKLVSTAPEIARGE